MSLRGHARAKAPYCPAGGGRDTEGNEAATGWNGSPVSW
jgi:hypothetical protein